MEIVNNPPHYQQVSETGRPILLALGLTDDLLEKECIDAVQWLEYDGKTFTFLNAVKYLWRAGLKGGAKLDLEKAKWYLQRCRHTASNRQAVAMIDEALNRQGDTVSGFSFDERSIIWLANIDEFRCDSSCPVAELQVRRGDEWFSFDEDPPPEIVEYIAHTLTSLKREALSRQARQESHPEPAPSIAP